MNKGQCRGEWGYLGGLARRRLAQTCGGMNFLPVKHDGMVSKVGSRGRRDKCGETRFHGTYPRQRDADIPEAHVI